MTAVECLNLLKTAGEDFQWIVNTFIDDFRRADGQVRTEMVQQSIAEPGSWEGLVAAVVSALCREVGMQAPKWVETIYSPHPFFAFPAKGFALRVRLMLESPAPFRIRNIFVPENYLSRA
jgi:hypothetical protein